MKTGEEKILQQIKTLKRIRSGLNLNLKDFAERFYIPVRTLQDWESGRRLAPGYYIWMLEYVSIIERYLPKLRFFIEELDAFFRRKM